MTSSEETGRDPRHEFDRTEGRERLNWVLIALVAVFVLAGVFFAVRVGVPLLQGKGLRFLKHKEAAAAFAAEKEFGKAISMYKKALALKPKSLDIRKSIAFCRLQDGDLSEAKAEYHRCLKMKPEDTEIRLKLASLYLLAKDIDRCEDLVDSILEEEPDSVLALTLKAQCHYSVSNTPHPLVDISMITKILPPTPSRYNLPTGTEAPGGNAEEKEKKLLEVLKASPDQVQPHKDLADFYRLEGRLQEAEDHYKKMVEIAPKDPAVYLHLADFYRRDEVDRIADAIRQYSAILNRINLKNLYALRGIAGLSLVTGDLEPARKYIERLLWEQSSDVFGRYFRGILELYDGNSARAERDLLLVTRENPTYAPAHFFLGYTLLLNHEMEEAKKSLKKAAEIDLRFLGPRLLLAEIDLGLEEYAGALDILEKIPAEEQDNRMSLLLTGRAYISQNDPTQAEAPFARLAESDKQSVYPALLLAGVYKRTGKNDEAVRQYELAMAADDESSLPPYLLGLLYEKMGEPVLSMSNLEEAIKRSPNSAVGARSLADAYVRSGGENADAMVLGQTLLEKFPGNFQLLNTLGSVFHERRDFAKAVTVFELIPEMERDARPEIVYHYAMALYNSGQHAQARRELEKAARWIRSLPKAGEIQKTLDEIFQTEEMDE